MNPKSLIQPLLLTAVVLAYIFNCETPCSCAIAGEPKDWIAFWGNYSGGIFSGFVSFIIITTLQRNFPIESTDHHRIFSSDVLV